MTRLAVILCALLILAATCAYFQFPGQCTDTEGEREVAGRPAVSGPKPRGVGSALRARSAPNDDRKRSKPTRNRAPSPPAANRPNGSPSTASRDSLWIEGRVLDEAGVPLAGIRVTATLRHSFGGNGSATPPGRGSTRQTWTDNSGSFWFGDMADGEYLVSGVAPEPYAPATAVVRAGVDSVDLVLANLRNVWVHGIVADDQGEPVRGVRVLSVDQPASETATDNDGSYGFYLAMQGSPRSYILRYQRDGYRERLVSLSNSNLSDAEDVGLDVRLERLKATTTVSGLVRNSSGQPLAGETVYLFSPRSKPSYQAVSDQTGHFTLPNVEVGTNYRLWIRPNGRYRDYMKTDLTVSAGGLALEVELNPMTVGTIWGQMRDADGNPIPRFSLWLGSMGATDEPWLAVTSDAQGTYFVDDVPAGKLLFKTRSFPHISIGGVDLPPNTEKQVDLVLDWGDYALQGRVVDEDGRPVSGPRIRLSWHRSDGRMRSQSVRKTIADASGQFALNQLGPGKHTLWVDAPGFKSARVDYDVTALNGEVTVRLETSAE